MQIDWQRYFLNWNGRLGRQDFWIGALILFVVGIVLARLPILRVLGFLLIWPQVCLGAKRLHDIGRSAVLLVIPYAVTIACWLVALVVGGLAGLMAGGMFGAGAGFGVGLGIGGLIILAGNIACLVFVLWMGLTPGHLDANQYGPVETSVFGSAPPAN